MLDEVTRRRGRRALLVRVAGSHFLWKMVRRMVGVLVEVGTGAIEASAVPGLLTGRPGVPARLTAPASGLFLERVFYAGDDRRLPARPRLPRRNATFGYFWFARASMRASARSRARPRRSFRLSKTNSWPALRASITGISAWRHCSSNFARAVLSLMRAIRD